MSNISKDELLSLEAPAKQAKAPAKSGKSGNGNAGKKPAKQKRGCLSRLFRFFLWLFLLGVVGVVIYAIINSPSMGLVEKPLMNTTNAILIIMLSVATLTTVICKVDTDNILNSSTFKAGMSACICILGVAWLGDTFVSNNIDWIKDTAGEVIQGHPWLLAVIFFFASALLYSQAATAKALMPMALALNVSPLTAVASFAAVSGLFILPTYPTLVAAVQMDDTGTTRIGKFVFNHPFFIPGTLGVALAVCFGFFKRYVFCLSKSGNIGTIDMRQRFFRCHFF